MLRLVPLGVVLALAAACGGSTVPVVPTSPAPSTASFPGSLNGRWRGYVRVAACSGGFSCATGYTQPFVLSVTNAAAGGYVAALETNFHVRADIELTGAPQSDGTVLFTGVRERYSMFAPTEYERITSFRVKVDATAGLTGTINAVREANNTRYTWTFEVISAAYEPLVMSPGGRWRGYALQRSCTGDCDASQRGDASLFLTLGQSGSNATGRLWADLGGPTGETPLAGNGSGPLLLTGSSLSGDSRHQVERLELWMNGLGRFTGRLTASVQTRKYSPLSGQFEPKAFRIESDIMYLTREW